jgi:hypothetical protein
MEIPVDYATWDRFQQIFVDDVSQQLQVAPSQVSSMCIDTNCLSPLVAAPDSNLVSTFRGRGF